METFYATEIIQQRDLGRLPVAGFGGADPIVDLIRNSIKFRLPENGLVLPEGAIPDGEKISTLYDSYCPGQRLPFECVSLEYAMSKDQAEILDVDKFLLVATQPHNENEIIAWSFSHFTKSSIWSMNPIVAITDFAEKKFELRGFSKEAEVFVDKHKIENASRQEALHARSRILMLLAAMSCSNVGFQDQPHRRDRLNKKREKSGKPPFYSYKVLTISQHETSQSGPGKTGRSPRVHLRRGHIRRLPNKTVWVNASVVGDKSKGLVEKDYAVPPRTELRHAPH